MDAQRVDMFMMTNRKYFPTERLVFIREKLLAADENRFMLISTVELKDPTILLLVSLFLGYLGIDRFLLGDISMGVLKLLTGGCCFILMIIDWFLITDKTKELNFNNLMLAL